MIYNRADPQLRHCCPGRPAEEAALAADDLMSSFLLPRVLALRRGGMVLLFVVFFS